MLLSRCLGVELQSPREAAHGLIIDHLGVDSVHSFRPVIGDKALVELNEMLPWFAGARLPDGRIVGRVGARENKRDTEQAIPDKRITCLHEVLNLTGRSVLEVGCFEGIHTLGLCGYGAEVTAIDIRPVNVVKTLARLSAFGQSARVFVCDVEDEGVKWPHFDVVFHCGVLYHLEDPVRHLKAILPRCSAIYLDTHIAGPDNSADALDTCGKRYFGYRFREGGWSDPFSGRAETAFWLQLEDVTKLLNEQGFATQLWSERSERNGPRVGLFAHRSVEVTAA